MVVDCRGRGKSTFSSALHSITIIPLVHLDRMRWTADGLAALNAAHFGNIKLVNAMHVLDICGHIGEQFKKNLPLAKA